MSRDMLALADLQHTIKDLFEKAQELDELEVVLNDTSATDRRTIERMSKIFFG